MMGAALACVAASVATAVENGWVQVRITGAEGVYSVSRWKADWAGCGYEDGVSEGHVTMDRAAGREWLRVKYPRGSHGGPEGGAGWRYPMAGVPKDNLEAEVSYRLMFEEGFAFVKGGKLPGLCGGKKTITGGDPVNGKEGWSARVMWRKDGRGQAYVYHMNQPGKYGDEFDFPADFRFLPGVEYAIRLRVIMNDPGRRNGVLKVYAGPVSGGEPALLVDKADMEWRAIREVGVDSILFNTFHGGSDATWAPDRDCYSRFGSFEWRIGS